MLVLMEKKKSNLLCKILSSVIACTFVVTMIMPPRIASAQILQGLNIPKPGKMLSATDSYDPALMKGVTVFYDDPFHFNFIIDTGENVNISDSDLRVESTKLIKYFLAALTVPEEELWVNLSPFEKNRIIPQSLGLTEMGRDMLAQDYLLKQMSASLIYPEEELGKEFWAKAYKKAYDLYGTTEIPMNTFNKVWIIPESAEVYEHTIMPTEEDSSYGKTALVIENRLKVMLEEDYLAMQKNLGNKNIGTDQLDEEKVEQISSLTSDIYREVILPEIEREVNEGKNFANLRQIFQSMVLAAWYKKNLKETILGQVYADQAKVKGIDVEDKAVKEKIYNQYLDALYEGVFNYIKEDYDQFAQEEIPRKYFAGGSRGVTAADLAVFDAFTATAEQKTKAAQARRAVTVDTQLAAMNAEQKTNWHEDADTFWDLSYDPNFKYLRAETIHEEILSRPGSVTNDIGLLGSLAQMAGFEGAAAFAEAYRQLLAGTMPGSNGPATISFTTGDAGFLAAMFDGEIRNIHHASDRGINVMNFADILHELVAFAGLAHPYSVAAEMLRDEFVARGGAELTNQQQIVELIQQILREKSGDYQSRLVLEGYTGEVWGKLTLEDAIKIAMKEGAANLTRDNGSRPTNLSASTAIENRDLAKLGVAPKTVVKGRVFKPREQFAFYNARKPHEAMEQRYLDNILAAREEYGRTNEQAREMVRVAREKKIDLGAAGNLRLVDGGGSSQDLPQAQEGLVQLLRKFFGVRPRALNQLPTTAVIASDFRGNFPVQLADDADAIEYMNPTKMGDNKILVIKEGERPFFRHAITGEFLEYASADAMISFRDTEDQRFVGSGGQKYANAAYHILHDIFGLTGFRIDMDKLAAVTEAGGLESSNTFLAAVCGIGSILSGVNLTEDELFALSVKLENYELNGLTGGQGQMAFFMGGAHQVIWASGIENENNELVNPYSAVVTEYMNEEQLEAYKKQSVLLQLGVGYNKLPDGTMDKDIKRSAGEINRMWMWLQELEHPDALDTFIPTIDLANEEIWANQTGDYKTAGERLDQLADYRNRRIRIWLKDAITGYDMVMAKAKEMGMTEADMTVAVQSKKQADEAKVQQVIEELKAQAADDASNTAELQRQLLILEIAYRTFFSYNTLNDFAVVNEYWNEGATVNGVKMSGRDYLLRDETFLYNDDNAWPIIKAAREAGIHIFALGAGGPGANMLAITENERGKEYIAEWLLENYNIAKLNTEGNANSFAEKIMFEEGGFFQAWMDVEVGTKPAEWYGWEEAGFQIPKRPDETDVTAESVGLPSMTTAFSEGTPETLHVMDFSGVLADTYIDMETREHKMRPVNAELTEELINRLAAGSGIIVSTGDRIELVRQYLEENIPQVYWPQIFVVSQSGTLVYAFDVETPGELIVVADSVENLPTTQREGYNSYRMEIQNMVTRIAQAYMGTAPAGAEIQGSEAEQFYSFPYEIGSFERRSRQGAIIFSDRATLLTSKSRRDDINQAVGRLGMGLPAVELGDNLRDKLAEALERALQSVRLGEINPEIIPIGSTFINIIFLPGVNKKTGLDALKESGIVEERLGVTSEVWSRARGYGDSVRANDGPIAEFMQENEARMVTVGQQDIANKAELPGNVDILTEDTFGPEAVARALKTPSENPGGIDLNPALFNLRVRKDESGIDLPLPQQPVFNMKVDGFVPIIIDIAPLPNLQMLFGGQLDIENADQLSQR